MSKEERIQIKKWLLIIGLAGIAAVTAVNVMRLPGTKQPMGEYITIEDARILVTALCGGEVSVSEESAAALRETALFADLSENIVTDSYVTYGAYKEIAGLLAPDGEDTLSEKYGKDTYFLTKENWYTFFDEMLMRYDTEGLFHEEEITVLATDAVLADRTPLGEQTLVADKEQYRYESSALAKTLYQPLTVMMKADTVLTIRTVNASEYQLKNIWIMETEADKLRCFWRNAEFYIPAENIVYTADKAVADKTADGKSADGKSADGITMADTERRAESREQVADIFFTDGKAQKLYAKTEKINGRLLAVRDGMAEIEGLGSVPFADSFKIYKLYGTLESYYTSSLRIGYDFTDFILENGEICAALVTRDEAMENIRVLIKGSNYEGLTHETISLRADCGVELRYMDDAGEIVTEHKDAEEAIEIDQYSQYLKNGRMLIVPDALTGRIRIPSIARAQGTPAYRGSIEIQKTDEGLVIVNELLLEEYLYAVVPSEMPASYPLEALKSQAVCARTYAYRSMIKAGLPAYGAHVDDSTAYQVYNNILENAETTKAVKETSGELLYADGTLTGTYYYSTSCGYGTDADVWKGGSGENLSYLVPRRIGVSENVEENSLLTAQTEDEFATFIKERHETDYEADEAWYRWSYEVGQLEEDILLQRLRDRYGVNKERILTWDGTDYTSQPIEELGHIRDMTVAKRGDGGVIEELVIEAEKAKVKVVTEYNVRYVLNSGAAMVKRQDGSEVPMPTLLPSAFFIIETGKEDDCVVGYKLIGGGYGHGVGMSQNAAKAMAAQGMTSDDILGFFYDKSEIKNIYENT